MPTSPHSTSAARAGMTLIEIMVVLSIMGMGMAYFLGGNLLKSNDARLREAAVEVLATLDAAHNMATMTGKHHRVVFDLKAQKYRIEVCSGEQTLKRGDEEEVVDQEELEKLRERMERKVTSDLQAQLTSSDSPEHAVAAAAALAGLRVGTTRCHPATATVSGQRASKGNRHTLDVERGIGIADIYVQHLYEVVKDAVVTVNFFPNGSAEKAVIHVSNKDGDTHSILVYGLTGRVAFQHGDYDEEKLMRRDGVGDEVEKQ